MDFAAFYQNLHGFPPFPWQARLARLVAAGDWPETLNLPTSAGKTALVDIWLWGHATDIAAMPRRLYYVIDRRVLVDAVAERAAVVGVAALIFRPDETVTLGGTRYESDIVFAGQIQFFEPGRPLATNA